MELNSNSINARLYRWFYHKGTNQMPKSLCPYFWQLFIMYVFIIPYVLFTLPYHLLTRWENDSFISGIFGSAILYLMLFGIFTMGSFVTFLFIELPEKGFWVNICVGGAMLWIFTIGFLIYRLVDYLVSKMKNKTEKTKHYYRIR